MALYLTMPVAAFHVFNSPEYFEKYVIEKKREMYPREDEMFREEISQILRDISTGNINSKIEQFEQIETERKKRQETN